ncbi:MAG: sensor histidine kinase [Polaribacter sp.]|uniref:sensor histidine kinase n=1 Tax=Polaribacter sp. TaxID=1920175 RepID=UPI002F34FAC4
MQIKIELKILIIIILSFLFSCKTFTQESKKGNLLYDNYYKNLSLYKFGDSNLSLKKIIPKDSFYLKNKSILNYYLLGKKSNITNQNFYTKNNNSLKLAYTDYLNYTSKNNDTIIYNNYLEVLNIARKKKDIFLVNESLRRILYYFFKRNNYLNYNKVGKYLLEFKKNKTSDWDNFWFEYLGNGFKISKAYFNNSNYPNVSNFKNCLRFANKANNIFAKVKVNQIIGATYTLKGQKNLDSASYYFNKSKSLLLKENSYFFKDLLSQIYFNFGKVEYEKKEYKKSISLLKNAVNLKSIGNQSKLKYYLFISKSYEKDNKKDSALYYLKIHNKLNDSLNLLKQSIAISDIKEKYETAEKEKENLQLKVDKEKSKLFLFASLLFILLGGTIAILSLKNSKRKQKLAEQEKALETQKNLTLLKEQELTTINAMVDGQEKERKRIAEDLHDNLGSVLATLKLHFENLKMNREKKKINQETLFNKTEGLIDEAYLKVRSIAHAKNAGVIANQGLLTAVQMMAEKISSADKIQIEVIDFGLDKRLENSLEISIFRIIQELITNILKHADAKNATINISLYDKNLNIIIEDDGKGFLIDKVNLKDGMGINSIKTRIEYLNGRFEVDSTIGKGSSIIIDIPVE